MSADLATRGAGRHPLTKRRERLGGKNNEGKVGMMLALETMWLGDQ